MSLEETRQRFLRQLHRRTIGRHLPLIHFLVFLVQLLSMAALLRSFNSYYARKPVLTTMVTNAVLGGIADTVAQSLTVIRDRRARPTIGANKDDDVDVEIYELDSKGSRLEAGLDPKRPMSRAMAQSSSSSSFDFERLTRFMAWGFVIAVFQHRWFGVLKTIFPITDKTATAAAFKRMAADQICFAPVGLAGFFTFMTLAEGGGRREVGRKLREMYLPSLKANYILWPAVQMLNFRLVPLPFQLPVVSTVSIGWTAYLSMSNAG